MVIYIPLDLYLFKSYDLSLNFHNIISIQENISKLRKKENNLSLI